MSEKLELEWDSQHRALPRMIAFVGGLTLLGAMDRWLKEPLDYGFRMRGLENYLTNQEIAVVFVAIAAMILLFAAFIFWVYRRVPRPVLLTEAGYTLTGLFATPFHPWPDAGNAREHARWVRTGHVTVRELWFYDAAGKKVGGLNIGSFKQSPEEIIAFIRKVRPGIVVERATVPDKVRTVTTQPMT